MTREQTRKDVDEEILETLLGKLLSPRELRKEILSKGISRATYFRHKKKLLQQRKIEELKLLGEDGKYRKWLQVVSPRRMANQQDIELYLDQMASSVPEICARGYKFFEKLCNLKRTPWYFSPRFSPRFRNKKEVKKFFKEKLKTKHIGRLQFLNAIDYMLAFEPEGSLWKENLIDCCQKFIEKLVWERMEINIGIRAFQILRRFPDKPIHELAIELIVKSDDHEFQHFYKEIVYTLLESPLAEEHKHLIRRKLDELSAQNEVLRDRVERILRAAKP